jgi:cation transport regulator ChaB
MKRSANGHNIIYIATKIKENEDVRNQLAILLEPMYHEVFNSAASSEGITNKSL